MVKHLIKIFCVTFAFLITNQISAASEEITVRELIVGDQEDFHLRILKAIPQNGQISIGPKNAENTMRPVEEIPAGSPTPIPNGDAGASILSVSRR